MAPETPPRPEVALSLALAVVAASDAPLLLLDGDLLVIGASASFCRAFQLEVDAVVGRSVFAIGAGEWDLPRLRSLLGATVSGAAEVPAYELDLKSVRYGMRKLVLNAHILDYADADHIRLLLSVADVTDARVAEKLKDDLLAEKAVLWQEVQHRVANSLQIIASVLMQSARKVQSEETRGHLSDAHNRVMSIAAVQQQLAASRIGDVALRAYFTKLCDSLGASMIQDHDTQSIVVDAEDRSVRADVSVSLGLIVTELVINALKHAFPDQRPGKIVVGYHGEGSDWTLSISDNGIGMPANPSQAKPGLGTSIVEALARQLHARIEVGAASPGTKVSVIHTPAARGDAGDDVPVGHAV